MIKQRINEILTEETLTEGLAFPTTPRELMLDAYSIKDPLERQEFMERFGNWFRSQFFTGTVFETADMETGFGSRDSKYSGWLVYNAMGEHHFNAWQHRQNIFTFNIDRISGIAGPAGKFNIGSGRINVGYRLKVGGYPFFGLTADGDDKFTASMNKFFVQPLDQSRAKLRYAAGSRKARGNRSFETIVDGYNQMTKVMNSISKGAA